MNKFLVDGRNQFSFQKFLKVKKQFGYFPENRNLTTEDFYKHFYSGGKETTTDILGSMACRPSVNGWLRWIAFDIDRKHQKEEFLRLVPPIIERDGFKGILEHGGENLDRMKYWIPMYCKIETARHYIFQVGEELGLNFHDPASKDNYYDEIFGVNKVDFVCRVPLGYHITRKDVFPIELDEEFTKDPEDFIRAFLEAPQPFEDDIQGILKPLTLVKYRPEIKDISTQIKSTFYYVPRGLKLPEAIPQDKIPPMLKPVYTNCQAANKVLQMIVEDDFIEDRGELHHSAGLFTFGMSMFSDIKRSKYTRKHVVNGEKFAEWLADRHRHRSYKDHGWKTNRTKAEDNPDRLFASCKAWDEKFGLCEGCPVRGQIRSPKSFIYGKKINRKVVGNVKLVTQDDIRLKTFPLVKKRIEQLIHDKSPGSLLLASSMGSGKSWSVAKWAADFSKQGFKVLIAVPTAKLAMEYRQWIKEEGEEVFNLLSHKNTFTMKKELGLKFDCPYYDRIQTMCDLGVSSTTYKEQYCDRCPFLDKCYYPRQYSEVQEDIYNIVVIQHAHLQCQEVVHKLLQKEFDVLFVDESFIKITYEAIKVPFWETEILKEFEFGWVKKLVDWVECRAIARGKLDPSEKELDKVNRAFKKAQKDWRVPQFIRFFNQGRRVNKYTGIEVIYELPDVPIKVFTDATPPVELLRRLTGLDNIEIWGDDEILDPTKIHPDNETVQILDSSSSRTFLETEDNLETILTKIGEVVEHKYPGQKVLVTVSSKAMQAKVQQFYVDNLEEFPTPKDIGLMAKGLNKWKEFDVQFLLAGRYSTGKEYLEDSYRYKAVSNYYRTKNGLQFENNPYYQELKHDASIPHREEVIRRVEKINGIGVVVEYPDFKIFQPEAYWPLLCYLYNSGETAQADRLRPDNSKPRKVYILGNLNLPNKLITKSILLSEFLNS